ncbi:MAG: hypothetical protein VYB09_06585 [Planctomycetota bacterium]|nr:hypothetical protein [Planctomycetota bacterium]
MSPGRAGYLPSPRRSLGSVVILAAVMAAAALVGLEWIQYELNRQISVRVEKQLAEKWPHLHWHIGRVRQTSRGIELSGVTASLPVTDRSSASPPRPLLATETVSLEGDLDLHHLLLGSFRIRKVILVHPQLAAERLAGGQWNLEALRPATPIIQKDLSRLEFRGGQLNVSDTRGSYPMTFMVDNFHLRLSRFEEKQETRWGLEAAATSRDFDSIRLDGQLDMKSRNWELKGTVGSLEANNLVIGFVTEQLKVPALDESTRLSCELDARFQLAGSLASDPSPAASMPRESGIRGHLEAEVTGGHIQDDRLPYPVHGLTASILWDGSGLRIDDIQADAGTARLSGFYQRLEGSSGPSENIHLLARQMTINRHFIDRLPASVQGPMRSFDPNGMVDVNWSMESGAGRRDHQLTVTLQDLSFRYARFPYPLDSAQGVIRFHNGMLTLEDFRAYAHGQALEFRAQVEDPFARPRGWLKLSASGPVPLDDELLGALDPRSQQFMRSLQPTGLVLLEEASFQYEGDRRPAHTQLAIQLRDGAIRYKSFPYPINRVQGRFQLVDKIWKFQDVTGIKGHTFLRCGGSWQMETDGPRLSMELAASDMALDDDLRDALGSLNLRTWQFWNSLNLSGSLDQVALTLRREPGDARTRIALVAEKYRTDIDKGPVRGDGIRITPTWFPYQLDNLSGSFSYADGNITLTGFRAQHDDAVLRFAADCQTRPDGEWSVNLHQLAVDKLAADQDLVRALPGSIGPAVARLQPEGQFMLNGQLQFLHRTTHEQPVHASWNISIETAGGQLGSDGMRMENLFGGIRLFGRWDDQEAHTQGEIEIDSVQLKGKQLTAIRGPLWVDRDQLLLGRWVGSFTGQDTSRRLSGNYVGGTLQLDAQVVKEPTQRFIAEIQLADGDLSHFSRSPEISGRLTGRADAWIRIGGKLDGVHTWQGNGQVRLRTADIDEAPLIVAVRNLVPRPEPVPEHTSSTEIDLRIVADHIQLERIHIRGDALSLEGSGWMNLDREINLRLYTVVGRDEIRVPLVKAVLAEASRRLLEINVAGSLAKPEISSTALPELDDTLQRILVDLENRRPAVIPAVASPQPGSGGVFR